MLRLGFGGGGLDFFQIYHELFLIFIGDIAQRISDLMNNAQLHLGSRKDRRNRLGEAFQAIYAGNENILHPSIF